MVKSFLLDYMHGVCLGSRESFHAWTKASNEFCQFRLSSTQILNIAQCLKEFGKSLPNCFERKPHRLDELKKWKATELRHFLLFSGHLLSKDILQDQQYEHFLALDVAMTILLCPGLADDNYNIHHAQNPLKNFEQESLDTHGASFMVYDVHSPHQEWWWRIAFWVLGQLLCIFIRELYAAVRSGKRPLCQIVKWIEESDLSLKPHGQKKLRLKRRNNFYMPPHHSCRGIVEDLGCGVWQFSLRLFQLSCGCVHSHTLSLSHGSLT